MTKEQADGYLFTMEICRKYLPPDTHPIHLKRLREIEELFRSFIGGRL